MYYISDCIILLKVCVPWPGAYTASNKIPCARKGSSHMRLDSLCTYTAENFEFLDTPVHIHVHVVTMHEYKTIMMVLIVSVRQLRF